MVAVAGALNRFWYAEAMPQRKKASDLYTLPGVLSRVTEKTLETRYTSTPGQLPHKEGGGGFVGSVGGRSVAVVFNMEEEGMVIAVRSQSFTGMDCASKIFDSIYTHIPTAQRMSQLVLPYGKRNW